MSHLLSDLVLEAQVINITRNFVQSSCEILMADNRAVAVVVVPRG